jgi:hypothetical protein
MKKFEDYPAYTWIPVTEGLPPKIDNHHNVSEKVLVKLKDWKYWHLAEYYHDTQEWLSLEQCSSSDYYENVTHWMRIPFE